MNLGEVIKEFDLIPEEVRREKELPVEAPAEAVPEKVGK